jgi:transmembrane sensor
LFTLKIVSGKVHFSLTEVQINMVTKELIERFFRNECTAEEQQLVAAYFKVNPDELEQYLEEKDWEGFETGERMDPALSKKMFENVLRQTAKRQARIRTIRRIAIAASVLLVVGFGWIFLADQQSGTSVASHVAENRDSVAYTVRHQVNTTGKEKSVQLPDGTLIVLADKSEITYREPFGNSRDIRLIGKASFDVARDKMRPFTVISGAISTTALGTEFTVTAYKNADQLTVRLYEGKVVVKAVDKANKQMKKDIYLLPGQEFVYGTQVFVRTFQSKKADAETAKNNRLRKDEPLIPLDKTGTWYMFNNQTLGQVLDNLAALYNVKIIYRKEDVQNIYFTGKYNKSESLEIILKRIGTLNELTVTKSDSAFVISK